MWRTFWIWSWQRNLRKSGALSGEIRISQQPDDLYGAPTKLNTGFGLQHISAVSCGKRPLRCPARVLPNEFDTAQDRVHVCFWYLSSIWPDELEVRVQLRFRKLIRVHIFLNALLIFLIFGLAVVPEWESRCKNGNFNAKPPPLVLRPPPVSNLFSGRPSVAASLAAPRAIVLDTLRHHLAFSRIMYKTKLFWVVH